LSYPVTQPGQWLLKGRQLLSGAWVGGWLRSCGWWHSGGSSGKPRLPLLLLGRRVLLLLWGVVQEAEPVGSSAEQLCQRHPAAGGAYDVRGAVDAAQLHLYCCCLGVID
jgi:hypothetical protein